MLKSCIWISSWFAGVSCTKVHNVTENKFKFVHTVQETAANVHKFGQLYKITEHHSRQCYDKGRSRMNCIHILRHKAHMHTKNWTNTIAYTVLVSIPAVEDSRSLLSAWGLACMVTSAVFSTRSSGQKRFQHRAIQSNNSDTLKISLTPHGYLQCKVIPIEVITRQMQQWSTQNSPYGQL